MKLGTMTVAVFCLWAMVLSGCSSSSGPSESEIQKAVESARDANDKARLGAVSIKKLGCKSDEGSGYICDVESKTEKPDDDGKNMRIMRLRMLKGSDGWTIERIR
jgi:hypothetical protein